MPALTLGAAKTQLAITDEHYDDELQGYVDSVNAVVEYYVGPVDDRTAVERWRGGGEVIALAAPPVVEVSSVERLDGTTAVDASELDIAFESGVLLRADGTRWPHGWLRVTYTAGRGGEAPASAETAAVIIMQHLWETKRGSDPRRADFGGELVTVPGFGFAVPRRAVELLQPLSTPGIA